MKRRDLLKRISLCISGSIVLPTSSILLKSCSSPDKEISWKPKFFEKDEAFLLNEISSIVMPNTEFPGAIAVGVPSEIESYIFNVLDTEDLLEYRRKMKDFDNYLNDNPDFPDSFYQSNKAEKIQILNNIQNDKENKFRNFYMKMKSDIIVTYFRSEVGATEILKYNGPSVVLGNYKGCVPLDDIGKAWAI